MSHRIDMVQIRLVQEQSFYSEQKLTSPQEVVNLVADELKSYDREVMMVINFTSKMQPINMSVVSMGAIDASIVTSRELFKTSILSNAANIIILHNHPSGDPTPSAEDINLTTKLCTAGIIMGIPIQDHIIVGGGTGITCSMKEQNLLHTYEVVRKPSNRMMQRKTI